MTSVDRSLNKTEMGGCERAFLLASFIEGEIRARPRVVAREGRKRGYQLKSALFQPNLTAASFHLHQPRLQIMRGSEWPGTVHRRRLMEGVAVQTNLVVYNQQSDGASPVVGVWGKAT
jgi:hypothetical protein